MDVIYLEGDNPQGTRSKRKNNRFKRRSAKRELDTDDHVNPVGEESEELHYSRNGMDNENTVNKKRTSKHRASHYLNAGFVGDENDSFDAGETEQKNQNKKERKKKTKAKTDTDINEGDGSEIFHDTEEVKMKPKKLHRTKHVDSTLEVAADCFESPQDEKKVRKKKKRIRKSEQDKSDEQYYSLNETKPESEQFSDSELKLQKSRKPKRKTIKHEDESTSEILEVHSKQIVGDHLEDTGYESFNKRDRKKKTKSRRKEIENKEYELDDNDFNGVKMFPDYTSTNVDGYEHEHYEEKHTKKKRRNKKTRAQEEEIEKKDDESFSSPSVQPKVIQVYGKKSQSNSFTADNDWSNEIDDLLNEMDQVEGKEKHKKEKQKSLPVQEELNDDNYDEVDLELEEMLLLTDRPSSKKTKNATVVEDDDSPDITKYKKSSRPRKKDKYSQLESGSDYNNTDIRTTEVVPFSINNSFDSDTECKNVKPDNHIYTSKDKSNKSASNVVSVHDNGAMKKPLKMYAFGEDSPSEEDSDSSRESDEEEVEIPVKHSRIPSLKHSEKPPKARKNGVGTPPAPIVTQSENFSKDIFNTNSSPVHDKMKPPRPGRKSLIEIPRSESPAVSHQTVSSGHYNDLKGIFGIDGHSYDVQQKDDCITWQSVTGSNKVPRSRKKSFVRGLSASGGSFRGSVASLGTAEVEEMNTLYYQDILGASIKKEKKSSAKYADGVCIGILIYTYDKKEENRLKDRPILFQHPSELECTKWVEAITEKLEEFIERPKSIKVFIQPYAGVSKSGRLTYNTKIKPLFDVAEIKENLTIVNHNEHIKQEIAHLDIGSYDCIVIVGGDGTVNKVVSQVLDKAQEVNGVEKLLHFTPTKTSCSFGIIPTGTTNHIVHSVQGVEDVVTSAIHIILGTTQPTDLCSVYKDQKFFTWSFNAHYGFFGNVLLYLNRYSLFADNKINASFIKALTKAKFRSYECEVQYIPVADAEDNNPRDGRVCQTGCRVCISDSELSEVHSTQSDEVQALDQLDEDLSEHSQTLELENKSQWKTVKGQFHNISVLSVPGNMDNLCPRGMSMFTHLNNGLIDLALIENIEKKEFLRYLRRHGKAKDQFDFPFIHTYRCKEVRFQVRIPSWKHADQDYNEIEYEMKKQEEEKSKKGEDVEVIDDLAEDSSDDEIQTIGSNASPSRKVPGKPSMAFLQDSELSTESENEEDRKKRNNKGKDKKDKKKSKKEKNEEKKSKKEEKKDKKQEKKEKNQDKKDKKDEKFDEPDKLESTGKRSKSSFWSKLGKKKKGSKDENDEKSDDEEEKVEDEIQEFSDSLKGDGDSPIKPGGFLHDLELTDSSEEDDDDDSDSKSKKKGDAKSKSKKKGMFHVTPGPDDKVPPQPIDHIARHREYVDNQKKKKDEKERLKFEKRMKSFWNIDNEIHDSASLHFRIHAGVVMIHGSGINPATDPDEVTMKCLSVA